MTSGPVSPVVVARIIKPHGIRGELVLESFTDVEGRLETAESFWLLEQGKPVRQVRVESRRFFQGRHVMKFQNVDTRNDAELLRGKELAIPEEEIGTLPPNHYFIHDLIGLSVRLKDGKEIGIVKKVIETGGVNLLVIDRQDVLIPFAAEICILVDLQQKFIVIDPPEGLLQLNAN